MRWIIRLYTRKCRSQECRKPGYHTAHLTWIGRLRYLGRL